MKSLVFIGNEQISSTRTPTRMPILQRLIQDGYTIEKIILKGKPQKSRKPRSSPVTDLAQNHNIPLSRVATKEELVMEVTSSTSSLAILVAFGMIVPQKAIDHFPLGIINVHPSLLPKYRGSTPIEAAILNDDQQTGVSIMALSAGMDEGDIFGFALHDIEPLISKAELTQQLGDLSAELLSSLLPDMFGGSLNPMPQDHTQATYTNMLGREDAPLDASKSADYLQRKIRAHLDWPGSKIVYKGTPITILSANASCEQGDVDDCIEVDALDSKLYINRLRPDNGKEMSAKDFINGYV